MISETAKQLASLYFKEGSADIEGELAKVASDQNLNAQSIERIVNRTNRNILVGLQKEAVQGNHDPHFTFKTIKTANIIAVLKTKPPSALPSVPSIVPKRTIMPSLDVPASREAEVHMTDYIGKEPLNKDIAVSVLAMLKTRLAEKKSKLARIEITLDGMIRHFEKCASNEMLAGTPIEVFQTLPIQDVVNKVQGKLDEWGHKVASLNQEFEIDRNHEVVKLAYEIHNLRDSLESASSEIEEVQKEINKAREDVRASYK